MDSLKEIQEQVHADSLEWFGPDIANNLTYNSLALCGEAGELANKVKKVVRGDCDIMEMRDAIAKEAIDTLVYLAEIGFILDLNLGSGYDLVRADNVERFGGVATGEEGTVLRGVPPTDGQG